MIKPKVISEKRTKELMNRFFNNQPMAINETVFVLSKLIKKLIREEKNQTQRGGVAGNNIPKD